MRSFAILAVGQTPGGGGWVGGVGQGGGGGGVGERILSFWRRKWMLAVLQVQRRDSVKSKKALHSVINGEAKNTTPIFGKPLQHSPQSLRFFQLESDAWMDLRFSSIDAQAEVVVVPEARPSASGDLKLGGAGPNFGPLKTGWFPIPISFQPFSWFSGWISI